MSRPANGSYSAGDYGNTVRVFEHPHSSNLYWEMQTSDGTAVRRSLGHSDWEKAKSFAERKAAKLREAQEAVAKRTATVELCFLLYRRHRTPDKSEDQQRQDRRQMDMWQRVLGPDFDLAGLSVRELDSFQRQRRSGAIDARGRWQEEGSRRPVSQRTVAKDLKFLHAVCEWATKFRPEDCDSDERLLSANPMDNYDIEEGNPKRPVATHNRVDAIREVYHEPRMRVDWGGERRYVESYLPEIFEIVVGTGRRISAVCSLRKEDLELERTAKTPNGAIVWPEDTDKENKEWRCPITARVRKAVEAALRKRPLKSLNPGPLFPAPQEVSKPLEYHPPSRWLRKAEQLAEVEPHDGALWHAYRRLWATTRKDLPDVDVAQAGGWSSLEALKLAYQQPDDETMLRVVDHDAELRQVG